MRFISSRVENTVRRSDCSGAGSVHLHACGEYRRTHLVPRPTPTRILLARQLPGQILFILHVVLSGARPLAVFYHAPNIIVVEVGRCRRHIADRRGLDPRKRFMVEMPRPRLVV